MTQNLLIRVDASKRIGTGHFMRCIALAHAWADRGGKVTFLSRCESHVLMRRTVAEGFRFLPIGSSHPDLSDVEETLSCLDAAARSVDGPYEWMVLDGYHFDPAYQKAVGRSGTKVLLIDDYHHLPSYHADVILNQNASAERLRYACNSESLVLLGPRYALLRREFLEWAGKAHDNPDVAARVLITMGGADPGNMTQRAVLGVSTIDGFPIDGRVVVGSENPHKEMLRSFCSGARGRWEILESVEDMPGLLAWADLAMTAAGVTAIEMSFMGVPFVMVVLAENQRAAAEELAERKVGMNLGWHEDVTPERLAGEFGLLMGDSARRIAYSRQGQMLVDGLGRARVLEAIAPTKIDFRKADLSDCDRVGKWANDPLTRAMSFSSSSEAIPPEKHRVWFRDHLQDPCCEFYIALNQNRAPIGQARFEVKDGEAVISVSLSKDYRGLGLGRRLICSANERFFADRGRMKIIARIRHENVASVRSFTRAGYRKIRDEDHEGVRSILMSCADEGGCRRE
jgi:UDP-2,4-diacetamido-2,4,6-trideoxy-beta-L-altropyranose hydrolase